MKKVLRISAVILSILLFLAFACKEKPIPPVLSTTAVTNISTTTAVSGGVITDDGGATIISRGICWNTSDNPTIENSITTETGGSGSFTSNLSQLSPNTLYYVRAYAINSAGTGYGNSESFTTLGDKPSSITSNASSIQVNSATLNGTVNPNLLSTTVTFEWGTTTSYGNTITYTQNPVTGSISVNVSADLSGLTPGTTYHFRIKAENSLGITYSGDMTFTTLGQVPSAVTQAATNLQLNIATINGSVNPNYLSTTVTFEWGTTTSYGNSITSAQSPVTGNTSVNVTADLSGLTPGTTYHFRIKAENSLGITYSGDMTFTTLGQVPSAATQAATNLRLNIATINGSVNPNYLSTTVTFEWGTTTSYGNSITSAQSPVTGNTSVNVTADLSGLTPGTTYHFRIKATNELGTTNSDDMTFTTYALADTDNNLYYSVTIGTQTWMQENLKTTHYKDGSVIPLVTDNTEWKNLTTPGYCWYNNDETNHKNTYGALYNWYTVNTGNLCPTGWHAPTDAEWTTLENYLITNGYNYDGTTTENKIAKALASTTLWTLSAIEGAVGNTDYPYKKNATGFTALPGGYRHRDGAFDTIGFCGTWWSATEGGVGVTYSWYRYMCCGYSYVTRDDNDKESGFSVRCLRD